jgi:hypothetical protein
VALLFADQRAGCFHGFEFLPDVAFENGRDLLHRCAAVGFVGGRVVFEIDRLADADDRFSRTPGAPGLEVSGFGRVRTLYSDEGRRSMD